MSKFHELLAATRQGERELLGASLGFVGANVLKGEVRRTRHFREWFRCPMNNARIVELPLTMNLLDAKASDLILDVSSPKLLALYYALRGYRNVVAADLESYFVQDFEIFRRKCGIDVETAVFDAAKHIPFSDNHFDKVFSVSVLEHIADNGDSLATAEMIRVLKPGGTMVLTLPAFSTYTEEWISAQDFYWTSVKDGHGRVFYQRRYDKESTYARISADGATIDQVILIAEKPIDEARIDSSGKMLHNSYYVDRLGPARTIRKWGRRLNVVPFTTYVAEKIASSRCHYLTDNWSDPNIRQVVVKLVKQ